MFIMRYLYKNWMKPFLFRFDPELVHDVFVHAGALIGRFGPARTLLSIPYRYRGRDISKVVDGVRYHTPVVLAAGFDYNARLTEVLAAISFGGDEIGSVTARPCRGNAPPRLKRCIQSQALVVNKGLRNEGVDRVIRRLKQKRREPGFVHGISIARTNDEKTVELYEGIEDYATSLQKLVDADIGDYYTINISCPNVHGGESFANPDTLRKLLSRLSQIEHERPVYAKMPINADWDTFAELVEITIEAGLDGLVIGNLNKNYDELEHRDEAPENYAGGLSGTPCRQRSTDLIRKSRQTWGDDITIIGCGGIMTAEDAMEKFRAGADLVQLISGMIFEGPHLMKDICKAYAEDLPLLHRNQTTRRGSIGTALQKDNRIAELSHLN